ncbi:unnamed protein product [Plutella xylostella]|uniref:(diamondback moth) hypothetical protein n=1 Tax=Plutella xylostella TaxID=51655 RepID=A0A8S4FK73_PLUXY|nr:unnamed protein product [Plutella xylostella]
MKRDESAKSLTRYQGTRRLSETPLSTYTFSRRQNSLTISSLAQQQAYFAEKAFNKENQEDLNQIPPVSFFKLFRFATPWEISMLMIGCVLATINGLFVPVGTIIYGEFTTLLIDRSVMTNTSTKTLTMEWFGGGKVLVGSIHTYQQDELLLVCMTNESLNGLFVPVGTIIYGEFTTLLIDRSVMTSTSTKTLVDHGVVRRREGSEMSSWTNASREVNRLQLIQDSQAFGIGCIVFSLLQFIVAAISIDLFNYAALNQIDRVKDRFLRAVLRQDISWYDLNTTMNFATKVSDDVEKFREGIGEKVPMFVYLVQSFTTSVVISFFYGWKLTAVILSCAPVIILSTAVVAAVQSSLTGKELNAYSVAGVIAEEVLSSIRTVVAFGGEEKEIKRYSDRLEPTKKTGSKKGMWAGIGSGIMWFIIYATYALAFWYGVGLIIDSRHETYPVYTPAVLMIVFFSVLQGAQNVGLTSPHLETMANARASAAAIYTVLDRKPDIDSLSTEGSRPELHGDIEFKNVNFRYPARADVQVLNGLSISIPKNKTIALVGSSGCGKSTVLQLIQRLYDPESGTVLASGHDLKQMNVKHLRTHIAVVGQEPVLFAGSIRDNIRLSNPSCTDEEIVVAAKQAYCHSFIRNLPDGYDTMIGERGAQLSGGQKQRIAIARALVRRPKILLLDEATSALDSHSEAKVQKALDAAAHGRTTVMVSHRLATVLNVDKIYFIEKGEVLEEGTHDELLAQKGKYYNLVLENDPNLAAPAVDADASRQTAGKTARMHRPKLAKLASIESIQSEGSSSESEDEAEAEKKEEVVKDPTNWEIMKLCEPEKWLMVIGVIAAIAVGASFPMFAILFGETYGLFQSNDEEYIMRETTKIAIFFLLVGIWTGVGIYLQIYIFNLTGVRLTERLRVAAFRSMLKQDMAWYDDPKNGVGALCGRLAADAAAVQGATGSRIGALMQASATIVIGIALSMYFTWQMTLVSLISVPMIIGAVVLEGRVLAAGLNTMRESGDRATTIATEAITNIRTVCAFCGEEGVVKRYQEAGKQQRMGAVRGVRFRGIVFAFGQTAPVAGYALSLWYGGVLVANREIEYKSAIKVSEALIFGAWMMGQALAFAPNFSAAVSAAGRVLALLNRVPKVQSTTSPSVPENYIASGAIQYKGVRFRYPTRREVEVLRGLSLDVPSGKRVALVGPSGCGKSTLIQLLQRLYDPDEGDVYAGVRFRYPTRREQLLQRLYDPDEGDVYAGVRFRYPTRREVEVLRGLSLDVPSGKRVALVGPSGCGKSTLIQLLQRLYDLDEGDVLLDEHSIISDMRLTTLRRNLGIVSQEPVLFDRTIAENIAYGDNTREVPIEEIVKAAKEANVHSFIAALPTGYDTRIGARASQLSGGQKQRIAIARALVRNPRVLLLDEATSALDTHSEKVWFMDKIVRLPNGKSPMALIRDKRVSGER